MRKLVSRPPAWLFLCCLLGPVSPVLAADPPASTASASVEKSPPTDPEAALRRALDLERLHSWSAAIEVYDEALKLWPSRTDFSHRRRLCETHYRIVRRYQDRSFRNVLLKLPRDRVMALYDELLERISSHYVDPVPLEPLVRRGLDNLEVALRDASFLKANSPSATPERVTRLRDSLRRQRAALNVNDRDTAEGAVLAACELARQTIDMGDAPVVLEFAYGACDALDDYTSYLTPDRLDDLYAAIDGNFVGLGVELKQDPDVGLKLVGVIRGGPAWEAGLKVGDQITHVGGKSIKGLSLDEAANRLQGAEGSKIEITISRAGEAARSYAMVRRHVEVESIAIARIVDPASGIGYVQLTGFQKNSTDELEKAIEGLRKQGMTSLVIDLRGNPGGLLNVAVEIAERFIDRGVIVSTRGRAPGQTQIYRANDHLGRGTAPPVHSLPLYVLIDHDSASASEILAGALKDHRRAVVFGERSYGKGSVQSIFALRSAPAGLKLTTAKFYSPTSRPYSEQGVEPDVKVHVAAKPTGETGGPDQPDFQPGDPTKDPVLAQAVRFATSGARSSR
jgi:carboxyl-terminal processing protease